MLSVYWSIYTNTLTYGHELHVVTQRIKLQMQVAEKCFLWAHCLKKNSVIQDRLSIMGVMCLSLVTLFIFLLHLCVDVIIY